ncbi:uncharacterized protein [Ptychodera flava]|uniref:uncharacterized protein n=1 Tax=Ptychodera flava TaxID=63121 RepID=UPI00396A438F
MDVLRDRDVAIRFGTTLQERLGDEKLLEMEDQILVATEQEAAELVSKASKLFGKVMTEVFEEYGISMAQVLMSPEPFHELIAEWHGEDQEVMQIYEHLNFLEEGYVAKKFRNPLKVGDPMINSSLVSIDTEESVSLESLHLNKDRPLAIVGSSLS